MRPGLVDRTHALKKVITARINREQPKRDSHETAQAGRTDWRSGGVERTKTTKATNGQNNTKSRLIEIENRGM